MCLAGRLDEYRVKSYWTQISVGYRSPTLKFLRRRYNPINATRDSPLIDSLAVVESFMSQCQTPPTASRETVEATEE